MVWYIPYHYCVNFVLIFFLTPEQNRASSIAKMTARLLSMLKLCCLSKYRETTSDIKRTSEQEKSFLDLDTNIQLPYSYNKIRSR